jgi:Na+-translocating ferredoxin:NAD+ oxidoreductase RnfD subunit
MVTDPKTAVRTKRGQVIVVVLIAFVEMLFRLAEVIYAPFYALFIVGPAALLIEAWWTSRRRGLATRA